MRPCRGNRTCISSLSSEKMSLLRQWIYFRPWCTQAPLLMIAILLDRVLHSNPSFKAQPPDPSCSTIYCLATWHIWRNSPPTLGCCLTSKDVDYDSYDWQAFRRGTTRCGKFYQDEKVYVRFRGEALQISNIVSGGSDRMASGNQGWSRYLGKSHTICWAARWLVGMSLGSFWQCPLRLKSRLNVEQLGYGQGGDQIVLRFGFPLLNDTWYFVTYSENAIIARKKIYTLHASYPWER